MSTQIDVTALRRAAVLYVVLVVTASVWGLAPRPLVRVRNSPRSRRPSSAARACSAAAVECRGLCWVHSSQHLCSAA